MVASLRTKGQEEVQFEVMRQLQCRPEVTQRELAAKLNVSVGGINYCLKSLVAKGFVKIENFSKSPHKLKYAYLLTPKGVAEKSALASRFLKRKMLEYRELERDIAELRAEQGDDGEVGSR